MKADGVVLQGQFLRGAGEFRARWASLEAQQSGGLASRTRFVPFTGRAELWLGEAPCGASLVGGEFGEEGGGGHDQRHVAVPAVP